MHYLFSSLIQLGWNVNKEPLIAVSGASICLDLSFIQQPSGADYPLPISDDTNELFLIKCHLCYFRTATFLANEIGICEFPRPDLNPLHWLALPKKLFFCSSARPHSEQPLLRWDGGRVSSLSLDLLFTDFFWRAPFSHSFNWTGFNWITPSSRSLASRTFSGENMTSEL